MTHHDEMAAPELAAAVQACALPAAQFRHRQHVQLGWYYLRSMPLLDAVTRFGGAVARFAQHHGADDKYDERLTVAYMLLIEERRRAMPDADWPRFAEANEDLLLGGQALLQARLAAAARATCAPSASPWRSRPPAARRP